MSNNRTRPLRIVLVGNGGDGAVIKQILGGIKALHCFLCITQHVHEMLTLASENEFDLILIDVSRNCSTDLGTLERMCEAFSTIPIAVLVECDAEAVCQKALRLGAREALLKSTLTKENFAHILCSIVERKNILVEKQKELHLEQALQFLQHNPVGLHSPLAPEAFGMKPLSEAMPYKFLELTRSYSNLIELATSRAASVGNRFSGHSVSQKLHFLASDLGALKAGVSDVIDIHAKAVEQKFGRVHAQKDESQKVLLELITDLVSYYRKSENVNS